MPRRGNRRPVRTDVVIMFMVVIALTIVLGLVLLQPEYVPVS